MRYHRTNALRTWLTVALLCVASAVVSAQEVTHVIQRGETLESVAAKYHVSVETIKSRNPYCTEMFFAGQKLTIPAAASSEAPAAAAPVAVSSSVSAPASSSVSAYKPAPQPESQAVASAAPRQKRGAKVAKTAQNVLQTAETVATTTTAIKQAFSGSSPQQQPVTTENNTQKSTAVEVLEIGQSLMDLFR